MTMAIGELRIRGVAHRLHRGAEDAAAVVDGGEIDALAVGEFPQDRFDRETVDPAAVEHERRFLRPGIAPGGGEAVFTEGLAPAIGRGEVTGETQGRDGILTNRQNGG
jgi:hypothetical protein